MKASFVAKSDVASWPLFGLLAKLQKTLFISRAPKDFKDVQSSIAQRLSRGDSLIIFPEGTSTNGQGVKPFKSSLFSLFTKTDDSQPSANATSDIFDVSAVKIMPMTINVMRVEGLNVEDSPCLRDFYAWYGDMTLLPHLWALAHIVNMDVQIVFHKCNHEKAANDRKALARDVKAIIESAL